MESLFGRLTELVKDYNKIIIASHKNPDLDALGSSLGLSSIFNAMGKKTYIFINPDSDENNNTVKQALSLVPNFNYVSEKNYSKLVSDKTLLVVLDVHQQERIVCPKLVDEISDKVVLDHHIKMGNYIRETEIFYIDSSLSSVVELIAFYSKNTSIPISPVVASIMLAGMEIDTNGFNVKITEKTFEAAAYLISLGADPIVKQNLLKESKDEFLRKADYIKSSYIYDKDMAICLLYATSTTPEELAEISEELLNFDGVKASFTIGQLGKKLVGISARSIGDVDVCEVMKRLGGGGHTNTAAVQVENTTIKALEKALKKVLGEIKDEDNLA